MNNPQTNLINGPVTLFLYKDQLDQLIANYKVKVRPTNNIEEVYKWQLINDFQKRWDENAADFPRMLESLNFSNLVYHQARSVLIHIARENPEESRANFKILFDESIPLQDRIDTFQKSFRDLYDKMGFAKYPTHQDERTIATYLTFRNPHKYTFYKSSFFTKLAKHLGIHKERPGKIYVQYLGLVEQFIENCIQKDSELLQLKHDFLDKDCFPDPNNLILAQDIFYQMMDQPPPPPVQRFWRIGSTSGPNGPGIFPEMLANQHVSIGWSEIGDLNDLDEVNRNNIQDLLQEEGFYIGDNGTASKKAGEILNFYSGISNGDIVVVAEGKKVLAIGEVRGGYEFNGDFSFPHYRAVAWAVENVIGIFMDEGLMTTVKEITDPKNITLFKNLIDEEEKSKAEAIQRILVSKNIILYGPPGTGKTYTLKNKLFRHFSQVNSDGVKERFVFTTFHQSLSYEDFIEGYKPKKDEKTGQLHYSVKMGMFREIVQKAEKDLNNDYAIFIDEINRGNISAIFGELITLLEDDKRAGAENAMNCILPYSNYKFSIPKNLYVIGTMNTADRSVEALDTALRRRFSFVEMLPQPNSIENSTALDVDLPKMLTIINKRLERLLDRDHQIGHSYFMGIVGTVDPAKELKVTFKNKILPLLQEYFYNNYSKIGAVLGKDFVTKIETTNEIKFPAEFAPDEFEMKEVYELADPLKFSSLEPFRNIYA